MAAIEKSLANSSKRASSRPRIATPRSAGSPHDLVDSLTDADYIVEAIVEDVDAKRALFTSLDAIVKAEAILASNTSSISITLWRRNQTAGQGARHALHESRSADAAGRIDSRPGDVGRVDADRLRPCAALGKTPVEAADYPGFIANRILMPMINEAIYAVMEGVGHAPRRSTP